FTPGADGTESRHAGRAPPTAYASAAWEAASSERTQAFLLVGIVFLLSSHIMYAAWSYWLFRRKVRTDIGYH
ncbi:MAG TPA: hypothetical protein VKE26_03790, partial [Xanthobacteraceae bacterium]|nr:hypothetical protein [Xanthobacteraceae bacterium]